MLTNNQPVVSLAPKQILDCIAGIALKIQKFLDLEEILKAAVTEAKWLLQTDRVLIYCFSPDGCGVVAVESIGLNCLSLEGQRIDCSWPGTDGVELDQYALAIADIDTSKIDPERANLLGKFDARAYLTVPISIGENLWGLLVACHRGEVRAWEPLEIELQKQLATQLAIAIRQNQLHRQLQGERQERQRAEALLQTQKLSSSQNRGEVPFRQLVETLPEILFLRQTDSGQLGQFLYISPAYEQIFGHSCQRLYENPYSWIQQIHPDDRRRICLDSNTQSANADLEYCIIRPDGEVRRIWERNFPISDASGKVSQIVGIAEDITERQLAQEKLRQSEEQFRQLAENIRDVFSIFDPLTERQLYVSPAYRRVWGRTCKELYADPYSFVETIHEDDRQRVFEVLTKKLRGECTDIEYRIEHESGEIRWIRDRSFPIRDQYGQVYRIVGIAENISDRQLAQTELQRAKDQLRAVIDAVPGFVSWMSADGRYLGVNQRLSESFKLSPEAFVGKELGFLNSSSQFTEFMLEFLASPLETTSHEVEAQINGTQKYYLIVVQKYQHGSAAVSVGIDITERKQAEEQIQASLEEKEVLLKEIHHRVKNNLQVVSSLLDLQSMQIQDTQTRELFRESQNRVKSIALIHEKLYNSEHLDRVNFPEYIYSLTNHLFQTYAVYAEKISLQLDIEPISLNLDTAIPCGLIINELVSNAFKHAFPGELKGIVRIALTSSDDSFVLEVSNDGQTCQEPINLKGRKTLGIQLIRALIQQLSGDLEIDQRNGTSFKIKFSEISSN